MPRVTLALVALAGILAGALGFSVLHQNTPQTDTAAVRSIVEDILATHNTQLASAAPINQAPHAVASLDPKVLNPMIESYLMSDPTILQRLSSALDSKMQVAAREKSTQAIATMKDAIFNDPDQVVLGNPKGDVTLVELFDYNCGYCRNALPDMASLLADDPNLRVVLKEFPILSNESIDAARVAILVNESDADYWTFHEALFTSRGQVDKKAALAAAADLGLSPVNLELQMGDPQVSKAIQTSYDIAKALNITGTPTYIIGNEVIPGAIGLDELKGRIANMRACGETECAS
ncbi:MAG: disulfide bond formation protein DsbA [Devosia sp.]|uniref:DsbA family protein n=1 Tax=Devosia sp. TaxID=1871048 RepID=UPI0026256F8D|nr:DsbA family protein [Devosia sp.]MDB5586897.1 disulfide bond formation protein DsbA [Devosia sp.]